MSIMEPHVIGQREVAQVPVENAHNTDETRLTLFEGALFATHPNGGGLVAITATVQPSVFVAPHARVGGYATVRDYVRLLDRAVIEDHADVSGRCTLRGDARVFGEAVLEDHVVLVRNASVGDRARLGGSLHIGYFAYIGDDSRIGGRLWIE
jgi:acyl-[acyl carrier protein]--UDP-N-acetylglucosamine O-acyltransferase